MTSYYRPPTERIVWGVVIALALALALLFASRGTAAAIRADERERVEQSAQQLLNEGRLERDRLLDEVDSLRSVVAHVDTVLRTRLVRVRDTAWLPADTSGPVRLDACRAELDAVSTDCERFRVTATTALAAADTAAAQAHRERLALVRQIAVARDAAEAQARAHQRHNQWRMVERGACVAAVAAHWIKK